MKKIILVFAVSILLSSCGKPKEKSADADAYEVKGEVWATMEYKIVEKTIDSCEYIIIFGVEGRNIIHKANCDNLYHLKTISAK